MGRAGCGRRRARGERRNAQRRNVASRGRTEFEEALDDDLNISAALGVLFETIRETNRALDRRKLDSAAARLPGWTGGSGSISVLGDRAEKEELPAEIARAGGGTHAGEACKGLAEKVMNCATNLPARGWEVRDTKDGQNVTRARRST